MPKMRVTPRAVNLGSPHEQAVILAFTDSIAAKLVIEAWPPAPGIEFRLG
jgi:hypothetical protein